MAIQLSLTIIYNATYQEHGYRSGVFGSIDPTSIFGYEIERLLVDQYDAFNIYFVNAEKVNNLDTLYIMVDGQEYPIIWEDDINTYTSKDSVLISYIRSNNTKTIPILFLEPTPKLGNEDIENLMLGTEEANALYLGSNRVWNKNKPIKLIAKDYYAQDYSSSSYTFNNVNIGDATPTRKVVIGFSMRGGTSSGLTISVTVNGETPLTLIKGSYSTTSTTVAQLDIIEMPEDINEVDIVISINRNVDRCGLGVWAIDNLETLTPIDVGESENTSATPLIGNVNTIEGGFVIGMTYDAGQSVKTWTGITEDFDLNGYFAGASDEVLIAETPRSVNCLQNTGISSKLVTVSLGNK